VRQTGIVQQEAPVRASKVMLVCTHCDRAVRVSRRFLEDNRKVRVCNSCGEVID
jgi:large subunit ribosomal protein L24